VRAVRGPPPPRQCRGARREYPAEAIAAVPWPPQPLLRPLPVGDHLHPNEHGRGDGREGAAAPAPAAADRTMAGGGALAAQHCR